KNSKTKNIIMWSVIALLAIILIVALILISKNNAKEEPLANETNSEIAATVNGDPIYTKDVMNEYNRLSPVMKQVYTIDTILNKSIDDLLLYQEALNQDIKVTDKEIQSEIDALKTANMLSDEEFKQALERQNLTIEDVEKLIERNLYIRELLNKSILQEIEITDKEAEEYYNANIEQFKTPAQVTVQHILVMITDTVDDTKAKEKIDQINSELTDSNFCELVTKYSEDPGSVANCGKYTFAKGDFNNPEFENPSFDLKPGEKTIVKTVFGYHLIKKLEDIPAGTQELSKVQDQIKLSLRDSQAQEKFDALLTRLREEAEIVNYLNKNTQADTETNTETSTTTTETSNVESNSASLDDFAKCLTEKGVKMYGAYWCPHCNNQKEAFASSWQYVTYVECAVEGQPQVQTQECSDAEISGYPTWIVNGRQYAGEQTLSRLGQLSGCSLP
ncbi:MAG TPA: peptidylprolyl isomerase, partial [Allocoleopsis sp.]